MKNNGDKESKKSQTDFSVFFLLISFVCLLGSISQLALSIRVVFVDQELATLGLSFFFLVIFGLGYVLCSRNFAYSLWVLVTTLIICFFGAGICYWIIYLTGASVETTVAASIAELAFSLVFPFCFWLTRKRLN
ncbi:MAG: hypothetical protein BWZ03_00051 [bacterium ADurb.BinA186]|jgi:hypothetical protein|nr:MAG: hypothetical protein BWZ03_00051 [bacterium ADurb.BinA186]